MIGSVVHRMGLAGTPSAETFSANGKRASRSVGEEQTINPEVAISRVALLWAVKLAGSGLAQVVTPHPVLFLTQVPQPSDFATIGALFGNHRGDVAAEIDCRRYTGG